MPLSSKNSLKVNQPLKSKQALSTGTGSLKAKPLKKRRSKRIDIKCHNLARAIWRLRGACERCGKDGTQVQLQGAHIFGTGAFTRLGADLRNGFCLCAMCHRYFTDSPIEFAEFVKHSWAEPYMLTLSNIARNRAKIDWPDRYNLLKEIHRSISEGGMTIDEARQYEPDFY